MLRRGAWTLASRSVCARHSCILWGSVLFPSDGSLSQRARDATTDSHNDSQAQSKDKLGQDPGTESGGLPLPERCKNLLTANWRAQLTTVRANGAKDDRMNSSLVRLSLRDGSPVVWLPPDDAHHVDIMLDERASLLVGGTDPPALVRALLQEAGKAPARVIFLGSLLAVDQSEVGYLQRLLESQSAAAIAPTARLGWGQYQSDMRSGTPVGTRTDVSSGIGAIEGAPKSPQSGPTHLGGVPLASPVAAALRSCAQTVGGDWVPFRFAYKTCQLISADGQRTDVEFREVAAAAADALAPVAIPLLDAVNRTGSLRRALVLFCAAYLGVVVRPAGAYMVSLDRWGFNVLGAAEQSEGAGRDTWREFRFQFQSEVDGVEAFCRILSAMEQEVTHELQRNLP